jgi:hypothetical protein
MCIDLTLNSVPCSGNRYFLIRTRCQYCDRSTVCRLYQVDSEQEVRLLLCCRCHDKRLICEACNSVIEGYPGQTLKDIRYRYAEGQTTVDYPLNRPIRCHDCISQLGRY